MAAKPGIALFYEGQTVAAQKDAEQVTIMNANNQSVTLYIDSHHPSAGEEDLFVARPDRQAAQYRRRSLGQLPPGARHDDPFSVTRYYNGDMSNQRFLNSVTYNKGSERFTVSADVTDDPSRRHPEMTVTVRTFYG